jgi:hypothetical protein
MTDDEMPESERLKELAEIAKIKKAHRENAIEQEKEAALVATTTTSTELVTTKPSKSGKRAVSTLRSSKGKTKKEGDEKTARKHRISDEKKEASKKKT